MTDEYLKAKKAGEKESKARAAAGGNPYVTALDDICPDADKLTQVPLGLMEIPVDMITGTKTHSRSNSFAPDFMPLLEPDTEFAYKWVNLYKAQLTEGFNDPIKVFEYLHRFYVQEGNKRVSVSRFLDMPSISADVIRIMPDQGVLDENPVYAEFLRFYRVAPIYDIVCSEAGSYSEIAELLGREIGPDSPPWPEEQVSALKTAYWKFCKAAGTVHDKIPDMAPGDAFLVYLRIFTNDALVTNADKVVEKRIRRIRKELYTASNRDRVSLVEAADDAVNAGNIITKAEQLVAGPDSLIGKIIPAVTYSKKRPLKAAFIYDRAPAESSWIYDHDRGRLRLEDAYEGIVQTAAFVIKAQQAEPGDDPASGKAVPAGTDGVPAFCEDFEKAVSAAADWGADVVFTTSQSRINDTLRAAIAHEDIKFLNCSVNLAHHAVRTYYAKLYEAKFLAGIVAGSAAAADGTHRVGYCSAYPIYGTIASINAFAIGAAMADPEVSVYLDWSTKQGVNWWWDMVERGIHVISGVDSMHNSDGSAAYGVCYVEKCAPGEGNDLSGSCRIRNLAVPIYKWGRLYEHIVRTIIEGTYSAPLVDKKDQATNYWWGMISGAVDIKLSDDLPVYTKKLVDILRRDIIDGRLNPFDGELRSQEGIVREDGGRILTSMDVITMDWLNENIIGEIPVIDALKEEAKSTVRFSGVEKAKNTNL